MEASEDNRQDNSDTTTDTNTDTVLVDEDKTVKDVLQWKSSNKERKKIVWWGKVHVITSP